MVGGVYGARGGVNGGGVKLLENAQGCDRRKAARNTMSAIAQAVVRALAYTARGRVSGAGA